MYATINTYVSHVQDHPLGVCSSPNDARNLKCPAPHKTFHMNTDLLMLGMLTQSLSLSLPLPCREYKLRVIWHEPKASNLSLHICSIYYLFPTHPLLKSIFWWQYTGFAQFGLCSKARLNYYRYNQVLSSVLLFMFIMSTPCFQRVDWGRKAWNTLPMLLIITE